jgi:molybdopterin-guanine dinucleotide biosynthesis protein A
LPGAYHRSALPQLESRLAAGDLSLRHALVDLDVSVVELDDEALANVNTREDLEQLRLRPARTNLVTLT